MLAEGGHRRKRAICLQRRVSKDLDVPPAVIQPHFAYYAGVTFAAIDRSFKQIGWPMLY